MTDPFPDPPPLTDAERAEMDRYAATLVHLCDYDPTGLAGQPIGMFHCPDCGCMVLAGVAHPPCDPDACGLA